MSKQEFNGRSYYECGNYYQNKGARMHRAVWEYYNGPIPKGYHVHHVDGNRHNNAIENLELKLAKKHLSEHQTTEMRSASREILIKYALPKAIEWHKSEEGLRFHSVLGKENYKKRELNSYKCDQCGAQFETKHVYSPSKNKFCSNTCKSNYRRSTGADLIERTCAYCGKAYKVNRYSKGVCCSADCASKKRWGK